MEGSSEVGTKQGREQGNTCRRLDVEIIIHSFSGYVSSAAAAQVAWGSISIGHSPFERHAILTVEAHLLAEHH